MTSPSHFLPVALHHASRLINHGPTVLITTAHAGRRDIMAAAWSMPVEFSPPRIAVVIDKKTYTRELAEASGMLGICVPGAAFIDETYAVGSSSGREEDKFARLGIEARPGPVLGMPVIESRCLAWLECRLIPEPHTQDAYDTCFVEVVSAAADPEVFSNGHWLMPEGRPELRTLHHLGAGIFVPAGDAIRAKSAR